MKKYIIIKADVNDGDYISSKHEITDENLEIVKPIIQAINEFNEDKSIKYQKYNWWTMDDHSRGSSPEQYLSPEERYKDKVSQEAFDYFNELLPYMDNENIHTIESIELLEVSKQERLL